MSSIAWYYPRNIQIDTTDMDDDFLEEIIGQYEASKDRDNPVFMCLLNKKPMYLRRHQGGRYFPTHFPGDNADNHRHESFASRMSDEHRRQVEYLSRAAQSGGLEATPELSTGAGTRLDIAIHGGTPIGFEVQRSNLTVQSAKTRAAKSFKAGWPTIWISDTTKPQPPEWFTHIPSTRIVGGDWTSALPQPGTVFAMITEFSSSTNQLDQTAIAITLDELVIAAASGGIIPIIDPDGHVRIAREESLDILSDYCDTSKVLWHPNHVAKPRYSRSRWGRGCDHQPATVAPVAEPPRKTPPTPVQIWTPPKPVEPQPIPVFITPKPRPTPTCRTCPEELIRDDSLLRGQCLECRICAINEYYFAHA